MFRVAGGTGGCVASGTFALILFLTKTSTKWLKLLSGQQDAHLKYVSFFLLCCFSFQDSTSMKSVLLGPALVSERNIPTETLCIYLFITARSVKVKNGINTGLLGKVK